MARHSLFRFSVLLTGNAATASAASASDYFSPHSLIGFQRYSSAVMLGCPVGQGGSSREGHLAPSMIAIALISVFFVVALVLLYLWYVQP